MIITRTIKEIPPMQNLGAVEETAAAAADWRAKIAQIETKIATENHAVTVATKHREQHALASTLGDASAIAAIKKARSDQYEAEQRLADLSIALPTARLELVAAERAAATARHELALLRAAEKMRQRVAAAARMDAAFAEVAAAYELYERLGVELQSYPDLDLAQGGMARWEDASGQKRLAAAVPICLTKLPSWTWTHPAKRVPLAVSEAQFWSLPPEQPEAKAA